LKDWVLVLLKIECNNRTCLRCLLPFMMTDNRFAIVAGDDLQALLEGGVDVSNTKKMYNNSCKYILGVFVSQKIS